MGPAWILALLVGQAEVAIAVEPDVPRTVEFATHLSNEVDIPTTIRTSSRAIDRVLTGHLPDWPEPLWVFFDSSTSRVVVVRPADQTVLLRSFGAASEPDAGTYALAIAAAELLRFARLPVPKKFERHATTRALEPAAYFAVSIGVVESFGHEPLVVEPRLVFGAELDDADLGIFSRVAIGFRAPVESATEDVRYRRFGPSVVVAGGWRRGRLRIGGRLESGLAFTEAAALDKSGGVEGRDRRVPVWVTVGPFVELALGVGLSLVVDAAFGGSASPADYLVRQQVLLAEGRFRWNASLGLAWRWP